MLGLLSSALQPAIEKMVRVNVEVQRKNLTTATSKDFTWLIYSSMYVQIKDSASSKRREANPGIEDVNKQQ